MFKTAFPPPQKNKTLGFINIAGLGIGMAAAFLILLWVRNEYSFDNYHPDAKREYLVAWMNKNNEINADGSPFPLTPAAAQHIPDIDGITSYYPHSFDPILVKVNNRQWTEKNFI